MISLKEVTKSFEGLYAPVLNKIDLSVKEGEFCILMGSNGCGKSTLLKTISKEIKEDAGKVVTNASVAHVVQDALLGTIGEMTLLENMALANSSCGSFSFYRRSQKKIREQLELLGMDLERSLERPLSTLSGGQRQCVATLMALCSGKKIILFDEHTSALDPQKGHSLMQFTADQIKKLGLTSMMITHKLEDALTYGDRLLLLHKGKIHFDFSQKKKKELTREDLLSFFRLLEKEDTHEL